MNVALVLAAGDSSRLGSPKQLLEWRGMTLIDWTIKQLEGCPLDGIVVVLGAYGDLIERRSCRCKSARSPIESHAINAITEVSSTEVRLVENENWRQGQGSSLATGIRSITRWYPRIQKLLVCTCDQPLVMSSDYSRLLREVCGEITVAAVRYQSGGGVPACFASRVLEALIDLPAEHGAKAWIRECHSESICLIDMPAARSDVDTADSYNALLRAVRTEELPTDAG